jgi:hypothetical protein
MSYENISGILSDIVGFIKSFVAGLKAFIDGLKTNYEFPQDPAPEEE